MWCKIKEQERHLTDLHLPAVLDLTGSSDANKGSLLETIEDEDHRMDILEERTPPNIKGHHQNAMADTGHTGLADQMDNGGRTEDKNPNISLNSEEEIEEKVENN